MNNDDILAHITDEEISLLNSTTSTDEWNTACEIIKKVRDGEYPHDWFSKVIMSGLMDKILSKFESPSEIKITSLQMKKYVMDKSLYWEDRYKQLEAHHKEETEVLLAEIKKLDNKWNEFIQRLVENSKALT